MKLNNEVLEKLKKCQSKEELLDVVKKNNIELSEEDLKKVSGGFPIGGINDIIKTIVINSKAEGTIFDSVDEDK